MISVDTVYQKVLALANKEQRGYITPQEFNLFADKAQKDILEGHFHNLKTAKHKQFNDKEQSFDDVGILYQKLHPLKIHQAVNDADLTNAGMTFSLLDQFPQVWRLDSVLITSIGDVNGNGVSYSPPLLCTEVTQQELYQMRRNPLTAPTNERPIFIRQAGFEFGSAGQSGGHDIKVEGGTRVEGAITPIVMTTTLPITSTMHFGFGSGTEFLIDYWQVPVTPSWAYIIVNDKALYNANNSEDFMLHQSDEEAVVMRILELSGISIEKQMLQQSAMVDKANTIQNQNN